MRIHSHVLYVAQHVYITQIYIVNNNHWSYTSGVLSRLVDERLRWWGGSRSPKKKESAKRFAIVPMWSAFNVKYVPYHKMFPLPGFISFLYWKDLEDTTHTYLCFGIPVQSSENGFTGTRVTSISKDIVHYAKSSILAHEKWIQASEQWIWYTIGWSDK